MEFAGKWITSLQDYGHAALEFQREWKTEKKILHASLAITALGVYETSINGKRVSDYVLAPGWTAYEKRLQYQQYDITPWILAENQLSVTVGKGWFSSRMPGFMDLPDKKERMGRPNGILAEIALEYEDGSKEKIATDESWLCRESAIRWNDLYDGETYDASYEPEEWQNARAFSWPKDILIPQEGEEIREKERIAVQDVLHTPAGETVLDFGQEVTGYVEFTVDACKGDRIRILHGEVLDQEGNFYNANYRSAKSEINYICKAGLQTWHPIVTFYGFRYIKLEEFPEEVRADRFSAIAVYSDIRRTGYLSSSSQKLNQLFSNVFWGQKGNFLDVPTDCPQRDERLGWTGDAQVFVKTASYNYDVERFFRKWLHDMAAEQEENGAVGMVIPDYLRGSVPSAAWGDAVTICPWQIYETYGNREILKEQFPSMKKWVDYITDTTTRPGCWCGGEHFGDWLGLDAPQGSYKGSSREELIATAFYAYSASLVVKVGEVLGEDVDAYRMLHRQIVKAFREMYPQYHTQTEYAVAIQFELAEDPQKAADELAELVKKDGLQLRTGFVGTPYILHSLSRYGHTELAYSLLLREEYPSWLYPVSKGATTIWEHWDGIMENGEFWSEDMNSFNHYSYGAVLDWVYEEAAGIWPAQPGFTKARIAPKPDQRLDWLEGSLDTRNGRISSRWIHTGNRIRYEIETEVPATVVIDGKEKEVDPGRYTFWSSETGTSGLQFLED